MIEMPSTSAGDVARIINTAVALKAAVADNPEALEWLELIEDAAALLWVALNK